MLEKLPADVCKSITALGNSLSSKDTAIFADKLAASCEVCDMHVVSLDKKKEKQLVFQHRQLLASALADETQPLKALRLGAQLLTILRHNAVLDVPNKAIPSLVAFLVETDDDGDEPTPQVETLENYHTEARAYLQLLAKASGGDADAEAEAQAKLVGLEEGLPDFKGVLSRK